MLNRATMMSVGRRTSTVVAPDGMAVVRHEAEPGAPAESIRREAELLALARGPGVVDLVGAGDLPDGGAWLATRYIAGGTLGDVVHGHGEAGAIAALASVASTLADLHERAIVHGRCTADHVVGGPSEATLCGFSGASAAIADGRVDPSLDTDAFVALVTTTVASDEEPSRRARRAVAGLASAPNATNLRAVATELRALSRDAGWVGGSTAPTERSTVTGRSASLRSPAGSGAARPGPEGAETSTERLVMPRERTRSGTKTCPTASPRVRRAVVGLGLAGCLALIGGLLVRHGGEGPTDTTRGEASAPEVSADELGEPAPDPVSTTVGPPPREPDTTVVVPPAVEPTPVTGPPPATEPPPTIVASPAPEPPPTTVASPTSQRRSAPTSVVPPGPQVDPTASSPPLTPSPVWSAPVESAGAPNAPPAPGPAVATGDAAPAVVEHGGARYQVGGPGDIVVLGDWDCAGDQTPSVVRPADGSVWVFRGWATAGEVVEAQALGYAPTPVSATAAAEPGGCDTLAITSADGREVVVRPG